MTVVFSTDPPHRHPKPQTKQSSGNNKKEIITKHDSTVCGRRNVKIMEKVRSNSKSSFYHYRNLGEKFANIILLGSEVKEHS